MYTWLHAAAEGQRALAEREAARLCSAPGDHDDTNTFRRAASRHRRMTTRTRIGQDVGAGLMFIAIGALGLFLARNYPVGTALRMEPGYVPRLLCWGIIGVGVITAARGLLAGDTALDALALAAAGLRARRADGVPLPDRAGRA